MNVTLFIPCFVDSCFPQVGMHMVRILERLGHRVTCPEAVACCGQPAFNAGFREHAKEVGEKFIKDFLNDRPIVCPSASCVGMVCNYYPEMFHNTSLHNEYKQVQKQ